MKGVGILPKGRPAYIDHLVPLCQIMDIPLILMDLEMKEHIEHFYPPMEIIYHDPEEYCLDATLGPFDTFFYADPFRLPHGHFQFADYYTKKKGRSVYSMHGNSDKKFKTFWIELLADEDIVLLYGQQAQDFLTSKGVEKKSIRCGNYRLEFYLKHKNFLDQKLLFEKKRPTILYAPTWTAKNKKSEWRFDYSTFFEAHEQIFGAVSDEFQLIVKLHPLYNALMPEEVEHIQEKYPEIFFLDNFPLIYPLLNITDVYLGDFSSIGYDFLYFNRPLFFLNFDENTYLQRCGRSIVKNELHRLYEIIKEDSGEKFESAREKVYTYAFGGRKNISILQSEIKTTCG